jgi:hypothetical protein
VTGTPATGARLALLRVTALPFETLAPLAAGEAVARAAALLDLEARLAAEVPPLADSLYAAAGALPGPSDVRAAQGRRALIAARRAISNRRPVAAGELAAVRQRLAPAPLAALIGHLAGRAELEAHRAHYTDAYDKDLRRAHRALLALSAQDTFQEGLRPVGRSLLERWQRLAAAHPRPAPARRAPYPGQDHRVRRTLCHQEQPQLCLLRHRAGLHRRRRGPC